MLEDPFIPCDLACLGCRYNLRGLSPTGNCPECGLPIENTVAAGGHPSEAPTQERSEWLRRRRYSPIAEAAGCTVDAVMLVDDTLALAQSPRPRDEREGREHVTAGDLCEAFAQLVTQYFNDEAEARELLQEWGIRRSEDVGRIVFTMVDAEWLAAQEGESVHDFDGLFTLDTLFASLE